MEVKLTLDEMSTHPMTSAELKLHRKRMKMTQREFAEWLGSKTRTVISWETNQNPVPEWVRKRLELDQISINPKLPLDVLLAAKYAATTQGVELEDWIAQVMRDALREGKAPPISRKEDTP